MPATAMRILVVGPSTLGTERMLTGLASRGCGSHSVGTLRQARYLLQTFRFDIVLAAESLPDGRGYELIDTVARNSATLFVGIALSESYLWLPVLERGVNVFGGRALKAGMIEFEVQALLCTPNPENVRGIAANGQLGTTRPGLHHALSPRRKITTASNEGVSVAPSTKPAETRQHTLARAGK